MDSRREEDVGEDNEKNKDEVAEMYQHIKEANKESKTQVIIIIIVISKLNNICQLGYRCSHQRASRRSEKGNFK